MVSEDRDPESPYYNPEDDQMGTESGGNVSVQSRRHGEPNFPTHPLRRSAELSAYRAHPGGHGSQRSRAKGDCLCHQRYRATLGPRLDAPANSGSGAEEVFLTSPDVGLGATCHRVENLIQPFCKGDGCIPCFVAPHYTNANLFLSSPHEGRSSTNGIRS